MKELFCTSDLAEIAFLRSVFESAGIQLFMFDEHTSQMLGGFGDGFTPCRVMVADSDFEDACDILDDLDRELYGEE